MQELGAHYKKVKEENPECVIYFESAHYLSQEVKNIVSKEISHYVDIMGMNAEELLAHKRELGIEIDKDDLKDVLQGLEHLIKRYKVQGIIMHTKDYSMYYGSELYGIDLEKALTLGNLLSGTRARVGHYGSLEECRESLKLGLSETCLLYTSGVWSNDAFGDRGWLAIALVIFTIWRPNLSVLASFLFGCLYILYLYIPTGMDHMELSLIHISLRIRCMR